MDINENYIKKILKIIFYSFAVFFISGGILASIIIFVFSKNLPKVSILDEYKPSLVTRLYDINNEIIGEYFEEKRILVPLRKIPLYLIQAVIATEDSHYYEHSGINLKGIVRAIVKDIFYFGKVEGGSSITQQLAKNLFLSREKTITRKIKEIVLSLQIEREYSKDEIIEMYLNHIYFGNGAYGVEAAARVYFGKHVEDLSMEECAVLAGLPRAPSLYSPYLNIERSQARRNWVLNRMFKLKYISKEQLNTSLAEPIRLNKLETRISKAPYFNEYVRQILAKKYGDNAIYKEGLRIYTTLDLRLQLVAEDVMKKGLEKINEKVGAYKSIKYFKNIEILQRKKSLENKEDILKALTNGDIIYGKITKVTANEAIVDLGYSFTGILILDSMKWAKKSSVIGGMKRGNITSESIRLSIRKVSDIIQKDDLVRVSLKEKKDKLILNLMQEQIVQGGLVCLDAQTGYVKAMIGGYDFIKTPFNRAYQAWRQPGSAFKPFIYTAAIDSKKYTPASIIMDAPVTFLQFKKWVNRKLVDVLWTPENYHKVYNGEVTLRYSLARSLNIPTIKVLEKIGTDEVLKLTGKAGLGYIKNRNLSLALGTSEVTLLDLTSSFGMFANQGIKVEPMPIRYIEGKNGSILEQFVPHETVVLNEATNYIMTSLLESVIKIGTAQKIKTLGRPIGGKTGTTDRAVDAWFIGFTPEIVTGMYFGLDDRTSMGQHSSGEEIIVPFWTEFMKEAIKDTPVSSFNAPEGVVFETIDPISGKLASSDCQEIITEVFIKGTEPKEFCNKHKEHNILENKTKFDLTFGKKIEEQSSNPE